MDTTLLDRDTIRLEITTPELHTLRDALREESWNLEERISKREQLARELSGADPDTVAETLMEQEQFDDDSLKELQHNLATDQKLLRQTRQIIETLEAFVVKHDLARLL